MIEPMIIITNNPMAKDKFAQNCTVEYIEKNVMEVYKKVRDYVHKGHRVLTHPLMSSIKPNEIPYRTVIISKNADNTIDDFSLNIIEESISALEKFLRDFSVPNWNERVLEDFKLIDYDLIYNVLK
ncbi:GrdX family protein [Clostridium omnivorum]|uniref:GrdX protein n=1 Tax=Clostridium omnivorum TaxID=1604902 RepID=A0ABQ5N1I2_9CLOT|nr:GrdX family protein [Clostridium sp. E14]GLC29049.1 GrdX protein [Clostridium sp. E14]